MRRGLVSRELLNVVEPGDVAAYAKASGWDLIEERPGKASFWRLPKDRGEDVELVLPLSKNLGDYYPRLSDAVALLADVDKLTPQQVVDGIRARFEDVFRTRLIRADAGDGTVPLHDGAEAIAKIADLFEAAAVTAVRKTPAYQKPPVEARKFLSTARLGQTEIGSYVVTVHSRLPKQRDLEHPVPFERDVLVTLATALAAAKAAVSASDSPAAFTQSVGKGVSANLCRALFSLGCRPEVSQLEFNVNWATAEPASPDVPRRVVFTQPAFPTLRAAAKYLSRIEPEAEFTVVGTVRRLEKEDPTLLDEPGSIAIMGNVHGEIHPITVKLKAPEYIEAIHAHEQGRVVRVVGTLRQDGDRFRLENPRDFRIM